MKFGFLLSAVVLTGALSTPLSKADDLFVMTWRGRAFGNAPDGSIVVKEFTEKTFVNKVAEDNGLDPKTLVFVYRAAKRDTAVVRKADGAFVADVIQMEYSFTDVTNPGETAAVRQAFLFDEYHEGAIGSAFGKERLKKDANGAIVACSFTGTFQYAKPDEGTVYTGSFATGRRIADKTSP